KISTPKAGAAPKKKPAKAEPVKAADLKLELADAPQGAPAAVSAKQISKRKQAEAASLDAKTAKRKRQRLILGGVLGVALLGAGGVYGFRRHQANVAKEEQIDEGLAGARKALVADDPNHWQKAASAAKLVIDADDTNGD